MGLFRISRPRKPPRPKEIFWKAPKFKTLSEDGENFSLDSYFPRCFAVQMIREHFIRLPQLSFLLKKRYYQTRSDFPPTCLFPSFPHASLDAKDPMVPCSYFHSPVLSDAPQSELSFGPSLTKISLARPKSPQLPLGPPLREQDL